MNKLIGKSIFKAVGWTYQVDETEGVFVFIPFMFAYMILLIWGMILLVVNLVRRKLNKS